jgi:hypothetical protein
VFDLGAPRDIAQAARHAVNDLEDGEAWPEEGLAHRELDMVQSRLNDLMLRNAPARVARGRQRRDPRAQAETTAVFAPMAGTFVPGPDQVLRLVGFKPRSGAAAAIWTLQFARFSAQNLFGRSIRPAFPKFRGCC